MNYFFLSKRKHVFFRKKNDEEENYDDVVFRCRCCSSIRWFVIVVEINF